MYYKLEVLSGSHNLIVDYSLVSIHSFMQLLEYARNCTRHPVSLETNLALS